MDKGVGSSEYGGGLEENANAPPSCGTHSGWQQEGPCHQGRAFLVNEVESWTSGHDKQSMSLEGAEEFSQNGEDFRGLTSLCP